MGYMFSEQEYNKGTERHIYIYQILKVSHDKYIYIHVYIYIYAHTHTYMFLCFRQLKRLQKDPDFNFRNCLPVSAQLLINFQF